MKRLLCLVLLAAVLISVVPAGVASAATKKEEKETIKLTGQVKLMSEFGSFGADSVRGYSSYSAYAKDWFGRNYVKSLKPSIKQDEVTGMYTITMYEGTTIAFSTKLSTAKYSIWIYSSKNNTNKLVSVGDQTAEMYDALNEDKTYSKIVGKNNVLMSAKYLQDEKKSQTVYLYLRLRDMRAYGDDGNRNPNVKKWMSDSVKVKVIVKKLPQTKADAKLNEVFKSLKLSKYKTEYEKVEAILAWMDKNVQYSFVHGYNYWEAALLQGESMCEGQTELFTSLTEMAGIKSFRVGSDALNHAWALVKCEGLWYYADPTNDKWIYEFLKEEKDGTIVPRGKSGILGRSYEVFKEDLEPKGEQAAVYPYEEPKPWNPFE